MALIKCAECGNDVSDQAAACPKCGAPPRPGSSPQASPIAPAEGDPDALDDFQRATAVIRRKRLRIVGVAALAAMLAVGIYVAASSEEDPCVHKASCLLHGECSTVKDKGGKPTLGDDGKPMCRATGKDCQRSQWCKDHGFCSLVPFSDIPGFGRCRVETDRDCTSSNYCKAGEYCTPSRDDACTGDNVDSSVRRLAVGSMMLSGGATCCTK